MIDRGWEETVHARQFVDKAKLQRDKTSLKAKLWDATLGAVQLCTSSIFGQVGEATTTVPPDIVDWIAYDIILRRSQLSETNAKFD